MRYILEYKSNDILLNDIKETIDYIKELKKEVTKYIFYPM